MTELNGNLIVRTTPGNHRSIRALLITLHKSQAEHFKQRAKTIEVFLLLQDAEGHRLKQNYDAALRKINQALRVDPESVEANALKEIINAAAK